MTRFCQALALLKLEHAWQAALDLDKKPYWLALSHKAMDLLNVELAMRVCRQLGDAGMVMALQDCLHVEDRYLLAGKISLLFGDYQTAQELFLHSSRPVEALFMRKDLMHWEQALQLAHSLSPVQVPDICVHYGQQLEFHEEYDSAFRMFESALGIPPSPPSSPPFLPLLLLLLLLSLPSPPLPFFAVEDEPSDEPLHLCYHMSSLPYFAPTL